MVHHGEGLFRLTKSRSLVDTIKTDYRKADIDAKDSAMLAYAEKLTRRPEDMEKSDVMALREHEFGDVEILDIAQVTAYYAFVNRMAQGLGVELEPYWDQDG